ncbi:MAG: MFS transporter [Chloroflexota bacterium]|nr:MFS transporter [Chloroflexota bacterium]
MSNTRFLRWFLQVDPPVALRPESEVATEVARNYRWNFSVSVLDFSFFWMGATFASAATILPLFVSKLTTSPWAIGLVAVIAQGGWYLPQLLTANFVERLPRKKPVLVNLGFFSERLPFWLLVAAALVAGDAPGVALVVFLVGWAWHNLGAGVVAPAWQDLVARCFPVDRRGRFLGTASFIGSGAGAVGAVLSTWILQTLPFPSSFVWVFGIAASMILLSWAFLALVREPVQAVTAPRRSAANYFGALPGLLRGDGNFSRFLVARVLLAAGNLGSGFLAVAAVQQWQVPDATVGLYTGAMLAGQTAATLFFGLLADRVGHMVSLKLGGVAFCLAFALAWLAPWADAFVIVFVLLGIGGAAVLVSGILVVMEFATPDRRPTYVGITNTCVGAAGGLAPLVGAALASASYGLVFGVSLAACLAGVIIMVYFVKEPRSLA